MIMTIMVWQGIPVLTTLQFGIAVQLVNSFILLVESVYRIAATSDSPVSNTLRLGVSICLSR